MQINTCSRFGVSAPRPRWIESSTNIPIGDVPLFAFRAHSTLTRCINELFRRSIRGRAVDEIGNRPQWMLVSFFFCTQSIRIRDQSHCLPHVFPQTSCDACQFFPPLYLQRFITWEISFVLLFSFFFVYFVCQRQSKIKVFLVGWKLCFDCHRNLYQR